jgi:hypothetical protein|tara:strand:+ start:546 stop:1253 length:708 start_codon:yes stop_codon:yes gene_type:complete
MAIINTFPLDLTINDKDAWVGTDSFSKFTKQYTAEAVAEYLNIKGKISISAQMVFKYWTNNALNNPAPGSGDFSGPVEGSAITSITTMQLSTEDISKQDVIAFVDYLVGSNILISEQNQISTFGHFTIDSYTINNPDDGFYTLNLTNIGGNGNLTELLYYDFAVFSLSAQGAPTYEFVQAVPSTTWTINHNLAKFPSITVIDSANTVVAGEYTYIDNNNVTLTFSAGFAGKAYLN